jgi:hypothetical protein
VRGFVTDKDLDSAETCFPGIVRFYLSLPQKPQTFLELVWAYEATRQTFAHAA